MTFFLLILLVAFPAWGKSKSTVRNEMPTPTNLTAVALKNAITLNWQWQKPEELPEFETFGYEVKRQDGKKFTAADITYTDVALSSGTYTYTVRVRGTTKEKGKPVVYISDWSESATGTIQMTCPRIPTIDLSVEPTQKKYASVPSMRFHLHGRVLVDPGCSLGKVSYHLDTGAGITHGGPLAVDAQGRFDAFVNAFGPEDEIPTGHVSFAFTASAEDEAGPVVSSVYTIDVELENPFAPHTP